jgi:hypothetical protein
MGRMKEERRNDVMVSDSVTKSTVTDKVKPHYQVTPLKTVF